MDLSLRFQDNGTGHGDVTLRFEGESWVCDSYYLALDQKLLPGREDAEKVKAVLRRLLEQWLEALQNMSDGSTAFLPYDFSDQHTGWLSCQRAGGEIVVSHGWSEVGGWSFFPSKVGDYLSSVRGFRVVGPTARASLGELGDAIRASLAAVGEAAERA